MIRLLLEAVSRYKNSNIDIVAFSMGSPMARKAFSRISVIRSVDDTIVGNIACDGQSVSSINGQNDEIVLKGYSHPMIIYATQDIIYRIIQGLKN
uniref:Lipase n=1 Tax=Meloidogyne javanica TaxID=6303 RepID=A0A915MMN8_MELJA